MPEGLGLLDPRAMREQALYQGLLGASAGILAGNAPSFTPGGPMRGLGLGLHGFQQGMQAAQDRTLRQGLLGAQYADLQRKALERQQIEQIIATLPADQQVFARLNPQAYVRGKLEGQRPPANYQKTPTGLQFIPGGPADPTVMAAAERARAQATLDLDLQKRSPEPVVPVMGPGGKSIYAPRSQAIGKEVPGGITPTQERQNVEIDAARSYLDERGLDFEEIKRRTQRQTDTGRDNPDYDPMLASIVRKATRKKIGDDRDFETFYGKLLTPTPKPAPSSPTPAGPSWWQRNAPEVLGGRTTQAAPPVEGARKAPDGNWYVPDPNRPGKYLRVEP